jgi:hypothetical protein
MQYLEDDPETKARLATLWERLDKLGWSEGRNIRIDYRFEAIGTERPIDNLLRKHSRPVDLKTALRQSVSRPRQAASSAISSASRRLKGGSQGQVRAGRPPVAQALKEAFASDKRK